MDSDTRARLAALGYVNASSSVRRLMLPSASRRPERPYRDVSPIHRAVATAGGAPMNRAHLVLIAVLIVVACEEDKSPQVPTTPTPNTTILFPGPSLSRLEHSRTGAHSRPTSNGCGEGRRSLLGRIRTRCDGRCKMDIHAAGDRDGRWRRDHGAGARTDADSGNVHVP